MGIQEKQRGHLLFIETVAGLRSIFYVEKSSEHMGQMLY